MYKKAKEIAKSTERRNKSETTLLSDKQLQVKGVRGGAGKGIPRGVEEVTKGVWCVGMQCSSCAKILLFLIVFCLASASCDF